MDKKIGLLTENNSPSKFKYFKGYFVNPDSPNYPSTHESPNYPRAEGRVHGFQNPLLGDPGWGEIARWQKLKTNALESLLDQMIEQYTRDRRWYSTVRCREALWNMYRRLNWWVNQNVEPGDVDYQSALSFIRDCIVQILDPGERPKILHQHKFKDGFDSSFAYDGGWEIDDNGYLTGMRELNETEDSGSEDTFEEWSISKVITYPSDGLITFNYAVLGDVYTFNLTMDDEIIWEHNSSGVANDSGFTFRDITLNVPAGTHEFKWVFIEGIGDTGVRIDDIIFTELYPEKEKPENIPKCPLPYYHHFASDYGNYFDGLPYERPTFSTVGGAKVSDYLDMIRYVSSKENIEWEQIKRGIDSDYDEIIFKLPLERLPETLSSKMTFNWRLKRKGYITFKYWVDGGNGSELLFYINNQLVGGPWRDTNGWQTAKFNVSQSQTYKFDFIVHKSVSKDLGTNAVYIKDIEVVEVTDYDDEPMPGDYSLGGEEMEAEYGKWLIYSHDGVLATYYRGFPDGVEDMVRELELEFYSECDGVFSFEHRLGTKDPDRETVDGIVFFEQHDLDTEPVIWDGEENGAGIPSIIITPKYGGWKNTVPDGYSDIAQNSLWTKDGDSISYHIKIDGDWDKGNKYLDAYGGIGIICPPKYVVETDFTENPYNGNWYTFGAWTSDGNTAILEEDGDRINYGYAIFEPHRDTSIVNIEIDEKLRNREVLNIYSNGHLYRTLHPGFNNIKINIPNYGSELRFEVEEAPKEDKKDLVFSGIIQFEGESKPMEKEAMYINAEATDPIDGDYEEVDERGRRVISYFRRGSLETPTSWYTTDGFSMWADLLPGDEMIIRVPNAKIPFVDYAALESMMDEYKENLEVPEPTLLFQETFNPFDNQDKFTYDENDWKIVDVFRFFEIRDSGDNVIAHEAEDGTIREVQFELDLSDVELSDGNNYLKFEYGALFRGDDYALVLAETEDGEEVMLRALTQSTLKPHGILVQGVEIPQNTVKLVFYYTYNTLGGDS